MIAITPLEHTGHLATTGEGGDANPAAVYLAGLSASGRRTMRQALDAVAALLSNGQADALAFPWERLRYQHLVAIREYLAEQGYKPATVNKYLAALRGVLRAAWKMGRMSAEAYHRAASVEGVRGSVVPTGRELTPGELAALATVCATDPSPAGPRDAAILGLMATGGLRRAEVVALDLADIDLESGRVVVRGKGNKERTVWLVNGALTALRDWVAVRGIDPGPLFVPVNKGGVIRLGHRLTTQAVYKMLQKRAAQAGVQPFTPHDLRRTFVSQLLAAGVDIAIVARMAGHASVETTARYDRRPEEAKRQAAERLHLPYTGWTPCIVDRS